MKDSPAVVEKPSQLPTPFQRPGWKQRLQFKSPLASVRLCFYPDCALILWLHGSTYLFDYTLIATMPDVSKDKYHWNELQLGLAYLPSGIGIPIAVYANGKFMDYNYKTIARRNGFTADKVYGDDLNNFQIELARTRGTYIIPSLSAANMIGFGWAAKYSPHWIVPIIHIFIGSALTTSTYTTCPTMLVDIFPQSPSTAAAATSIVRCTLAAGGVAILQPLLNVIGRGWYFTALGVFYEVCSMAALFVVRRKGMEWRKRRTTTYVSLFDSISESILIPLCVVANDSGNDEEGATLGSPWHLLLLQAWQSRSGFTSSHVILLDLDFL